MSHSDSPYAAPGSDSGWNAGGESTGNYALGFLGGFFCGCIGLLVVHVTSAGPQTRQGAWMGFVVQMLLGFALRAFELSLD